jgi:hypothetical protein
MLPIPDALEALVARQAGMLTRWQALAAGVSEYVIRRRLRSARWQVHSPGVYATFSGELSRSSTLWGAVLACSQQRFQRAPHAAHGPDAVLSHETAAELYGLVDQPDPIIHVTIPNGRRLPRPINGIRVHISTRLAKARHPALLPPRTRVDETAVDLTQTVRTLDTAINWLSMVCGERLTTPQRLAAAIDTRKKLRWRRELLSALGDTASGDHNLLELRYHRHVERAHGLPIGVRQAPRQVGRRMEYDDVAYEGFGVIVHLDGRIHQYAERFRDMMRDNAAVIRGEAPLRFGWFDVNERPCDVAEQVGLVLTRNGWRTRPTRCGPTCTVIP